MARADRRRALIALSGCHADFCIHSYDFRSQMGEQNVRAVPTIAISSPLRYLRESTLLHHGNLEWSTHMSNIERHGITRRWSDAVVYHNTIHFVEIADDSSQDMAGQVRQILGQIDQRLAQVGSDRTRLLQVLIYVSDIQATSVLNALWDEWVPEGHAPARACVQVVMGKGYLVEMVITAAMNTK